MSDESQLLAAQRKELQQAKEQARQAKASAEAEKEAANAIKGEHRVAQPDDWSIL